MSRTSRPVAFGAAAAVVACLALSALAAAEAPRSAVVLPRGVTPTSLATRVANGPDGSPWRCGHCHTDTGWHNIPAKVAFDHATTGVPLSGRHATAPCRGCHNGHLGEQGMARTCRSCHTNPPGTEAHRGEEGRRCEDCHTSHSWRDARQPVNHDRSRFPLTGAHGAVSCRSCHRQQRRSTWRGTPATCDACHRSASLGVKTFDHRRTGRGCQACHSTFAWAPGRLDHAVFWPLDGAHAALKDDCTRCHGGEAFTAASKACATCHLGLVTGGKTHPDHLSLGFPRRCEDCHTTASWNALLSGWHEGFFPIAGGEHARYRNNCQSCHPTGMGPGRFDCIHCHDGTHDKGRMDSEHDDEGGYVWKNEACLGCHPKGEH